ncbi:MAG: sel1 repeat family protein, partial [Rhizobiales bacterium]|nr:sel1 repeat family protein [Hyphomicrobiales bacterium]
MQGRGVPLDYGEAVRLYRKAADKGNSHALFLLGGMYEAGSGVGQDSKIAASHVFQSLKQGNTYAAKKIAANPDGWSTPFHRELQRLLKEDGIYSGPLDGRFGLAVQSSIDALLRK